MSDTPKRGRPVRYIATGEVFRTIYEACEAKKVSYNAIWESCNGYRKKKNWEFAGPPTKLGKAAAWTPEEDEILKAHIGEKAQDFQHLLPDRSVQSIQQRVRYLAYQRITREKYEDELHRPLTEETAYQCRIEYADKIALGYTPEKAIKWVAEANIRSVEIVRDVLFNPAYDAQVAECKRRYTHPDIAEPLDGDIEAIFAELKKRADGAPNYNYCPVVGTHLLTGKVIVFSSIKDAADMGFSPSAISRCINGRAKNHQGYKWERATDYNPQGGEKA